MLHAEAEIGKPAPSFTLPTCQSKSVSLSDFKGKVVVLEWTNYSCPFVVKHYGSGNMQKLQADAAAKGVVWLSICSSAPGKQGHAAPADAVKACTERNSAATAYLIDESGAAPDVPVIADARRDSWHVFTRAGGLRREPSAGLSGAFVTPAGFRHWSPLPADTTVVPYDLPALLHSVWKTPLLSPCPDPDAFLHEDPTYVTWTPRIHQAPET